MVLRVKNFCYPTVPWAPSPPFGRTTCNNLSLEINAHRNHEYKPVSYMIFWVLRLGPKFQQALGII